MNETKLAHFKKVLLEEKTRIEDERASYNSDTRGGSMADQSGELSNADSNDMADEATLLYDRDRDVAAVENLDRLLAKINRALMKIDEGTYGKSDVDGTPIPIERLEALPYAVTTVEQEEAL
ncbi:MAG: hypothetical protein ABIY70_28590 [Capsulimonas sp.]|uniref:hypothetical protein n=1 Tax=Capsulimonas sp. TaxID=2494211 RepID=UPI00326571F3